MPGYTRRPRLPTQPGPGQSQDARARRGSNCRPLHLRAVPLPPASPDPQDRPRRDRPSAEDQGIPGAENVGANGHARRALRHHHVRLGRQLPGSRRDAPVHARAAAPYPAFDDPTYQRRLADTNGSPARSATWPTASSTSTSPATPHRCSPTATPRSPTSCPRGSAARPTASTASTSLRSASSARLAKRSLIIRRSASMPHSGVGDNASAISRTQARARNLPKSRTQIGPGRGAAARADDRFDRVARAARAIASATPRSCGLPASARSRPHACGRRSPATKPHKDESRSQTLRMSLPCSSPSQARLRRCYWNLERRKSPVGGRSYDHARGVQYDSCREGIEPFHKR